MIRAALVLAIFVLAGCGSTAKASFPPEPPRVIDLALRHAAAKWHVSYRTLRRISYCESRYNPRARNPRPVWDGEHAVGLFQFLPSTWRSTPYRNRWILSGYWNALAAAYMFHVGRGREWACR